jgi:hypothetical protein
VAGHYVLEGAREVGSELLLKPDGTFEYMLAYGAADYTASGTWKREGGSVVLNSGMKKDPPFRLIGSATVKSPGARVWVKAPNGRGIPNIDVALKTTDGELTGRTDSDGVAYFPGRGSAREAIFSIRVYHVEAGPYQLDPRQNDFTFEINGAAITGVPFENERLTINKQTLEMRYWDPDRVMTYRKQ